MIELGYGSAKIINWSYGLIDMNCLNKTFLFTMFASSVGVMKRQLERKVADAMRMMSWKELMTRRNSSLSMLGRSCGTIRSGVTLPLPKMMVALRRGSVIMVQIHQALKLLNQSISRVWRLQRPVVRRLWQRIMRWMGFRECGTLNSRTWQWRRDYQRWVYLTLLLQKKNL